jgi:hypothetical protein
MLKATVDGLKRLRRPEEVAAARGLTVIQVLPVSAKHEDEALAETTLQQTVTNSEEPASEPVVGENGEAQDQADA